MKVKKLYNFGLIIEHLNKLVYHNNFGISKEEFSELKKSLILAIDKLKPKDQQSLSNKLEQFKKADTLKKKESIAKKIGRIFENYVVGIASKITADIITKVFMGI